MIPALMVRVLVCGNAAVM